MANFFSLYFPMFHSYWTILKVQADAPRPRYQKKKHFITENWDLQQQVLRLTYAEFQKMKLFSNLKN